jgi:hypothetical protein
MALLLRREPMGAHEGKIFSFKASQASDTIFSTVTEAK